MDTFEELDLPPELVEALLAEGLEHPTSLQAEAIPTLRRGNSALLRGGPGAGVLMAFGAPILDRIEGGRGRPEALVVTNGSVEAIRMARSLARPAAALGLRVAALEGGFALPTHADILFGTLSGLREAVAHGNLKVEELVALVLTGSGALLEAPEAREGVQELLELASHDELQVILTADPVTETVQTFLRNRVRRAVHIPSDAGSHGTGEAPGIQRGTLRMATLEGDELPALASLAARLLDEEGKAHLLLFFAGEDRAADVGDFLTLHGYLASAPGDPEAPVWLGIDALEARRILEERSAGGEVLRLSVDLPHDADELDRRHGGGGDGVVLARPRELAHLKRIAREAGYQLTPLPADPAREAAAERFHGEVEAALEERDLLPYHLLLEPLHARHGSAAVAAALAALLRDRRAAAYPGPGPQPAAGARVSGAPTAFVRLFLSIGSRDGVGPGDLLGAITGETGIPGERVGRIELRDTFARVEVEEQVADQIIRALNGTTLRGRSVRVDYDRSQDRGTSSQAPTRSDRRPAPGRNPGARGGKGPGRT